MAKGKVVVADNHLMNSQKLAADRIAGSVSKQSLISAPLGSSSRGQPSKPVMLQKLNNA